MNVDAGANGGEKRDAFFPVELGAGFGDPRELLVGAAPVGSVGRRLRWAIVLRAVFVHHSPSLARTFSSSACAVGREIAESIGNFCNSKAESAWAADECPQRAIANAARHSATRASPNSSSEIDQSAEISRPRRAAPSHTDVSTARIASPAVEYCALGKFARHALLGQPQSRAPHLYRSPPPHRSPRAQKARHAPRSEPGRDAPCHHSRARERAHRRHRGRGRRFAAHVQQLLLQQVRSHLQPGHRSGPSHWRRAAQAFGLPSRCGTPSPTPCSSNTQAPTRR